MTYERRQTRAQLLLQATEPRHGATYTLTYTFGCPRHRTMQAERTPLTCLRHTYLHSWFTPQVGSPFCWVQLLGRVLLPTNFSSDHHPWLAALLPPTTTRSANTCARDMPSSSTVTHARRRLSMRRGYYGARFLSVGKHSSGSDLVHDRTPHYCTTPRCHLWSTISVGVLFGGFIPFTTVQ